MQSSLCYTGIGNKSTGYSYLLLLWFRWSSFNGMSTFGNMNFVLFVHHITNVVVLVLWSSWTGWLIFIIVLELFEEVDTSIYVLLVSENCRSGLGNWGSSCCKVYCQTWYKTKGGSFLWNLKFLYMLIIDYAFLFCSCILVFLVLFVWSYLLHILIFSVYIQNAEVIDSVSFIKYHKFHALRTHLRIILILLINCHPFSRVWQ